MDIAKPAFLSCDLETDNSLDPRNKPIDQLGFGYGKGLVIREKYQESKRDVYQSLFNKFPIVFHNMLFDLDYLEYYGYKIPHPLDSMGGMHLLNPDLPLGLDFVNTLYVHIEPWKNLRRREPGFYHSRDLDVTWRAWDRIESDLKSRGLWHLYTTEWIPATLTSLKMKQGGIKIDRQRMTILNIALNRQLEKIDGALKHIANIDWASPKQIMHLFYDVLHLPVQLHRKTAKPTTGADALEALESTNHPAVKLLLTRRAIDKMRSTYTDYSLDSKDFYHGDISFTAATGRGRGFLFTIQRGAMRSLFIPDEPDWEFLYADWSQVELWISAIRSGDLVMQEILARESLHNYAARKFFSGYINKKQSPIIYENAKHITHGTNFGRSEGSISRDHEIPLNEVRKVLKGLFGDFRVWNAWRLGQYQKAVTVGELTNPFGFTRAFWSGNIRGMTYAFEPQSCVAHMLKRVIVQIDQQLPKPARLVLPYHDAVLVAYPKPMRPEVTECVKTLMEQEWPQLGGWKARCEIGYGDSFQAASED